MTHATPSPIIIDAAQTRASLPALATEIAQYEHQLALLTGRAPAELRGTLAAAALCEVDEIYAVGGAQAVFALARGTETISPVEVIAGPGNAWVQAAKREVFGEVAIDSLAGPSDLTVVIDSRTNLRWAALDLCAQAEHGDESLRR